MDLKVPDGLPAGHLCLQDCWECVGSSMSIHVCPHGGEGLAWEGGVEEGRVIPNTTPELALAKLARFSSLTCVLPPLPANPLWDASDTGSWLSPWLFQQVPPVAPRHSIRSCILNPQGEVRGDSARDWGPHQQPPNSGHGRGCTLIPSPCSGIPASRCQQSSRCLPNSEESVYKAHKSPFHLSHQKTPPETMRKLDAAT